MKYLYTDLNNTMYYNNTNMSHHAINGCLNDMLKVKINYYQNNIEYMYL